MNGAGSGDRAGGRRIVFTAVGSLGDVHPYLAIAQELQRRGHHPVVATLPGLQERVEAAGLTFAPLRALEAERPSPELVRQVFRGPRGIEFLLRGLVVPSLRTAYEDTLRLAKDADLLVSHPLTWTTPLVAQHLGRPWVSTQLAPTGLLSAYDPPLLPGQRWLFALRHVPAIWRAVYGLARVLSDRWMGPYHTLRRELGLPDTGNPMFAGGRSPWGTLALFSPRFGAPQQDWPVYTVPTGFPFYEQPEGLDPALEAWLAAGPPPLIFTLGSSAVMMPGMFFRESAEAARRLGRRALLLGAEETLPAGDVFALRYGPYARIFRRGALVVHQGGIGTTAEVLRAGVPMLVVPFGADQPDNAARVERLQVGRSLHRESYRARRVTRELRLLLEQPAYSAQASALGAAIDAEQGAERAGDALEAVLGQAGYVR